VSRSPKKPHLTYWATSPSVGGVDMAAGGMYGTL
jgi:hypothetical protein